MDVNGGNVRQYDLHCALIYVNLLNFCAANMKVITAIYLNCRPDLRDEWLTGTEVDDVGDAQVSYLM